MDLDDMHLAPSRYAGWENECLQNFRDTADESSGNATNFLHVSVALNAANCRFFSQPVCI